MPQTTVTFISCESFSPFDSRSPSHLYLSRTHRYAVQGALTALQCCIKHINKSMYAVATMKGHGFFASLQHTGMLLTSNILTVSALKISSLFIIILGKGMVTLASAASCYVWLAYGAEFADGAERDLSSNLLPFSINVLVAFLVATAFFYTFVDNQPTHPAPFCVLPLMLYPLRKIETFHHESDGTHSPTHCTRPLQQ